MPRGINAYDEGRIQGRNVANANSLNIVSPGIVTDGLVLHLDAGNYNSYPIAGTTWYDLSGYGNNGTLTNGPIYARDGGGSISLDGTNDYIQANTPFYTNNRSITVILWIRSASLITPATTIGVLSGTYNNRTYWPDGGGLGYISVWAGISGTGGNACLLFESRASVAGQPYLNVATGEFNIYSTNWVMVGIQIAPSSISSFYNNGVSSQISTVSDTRQGFTFNGWRFAEKTFGGALWGGNIANLSIYNTVLSAQEIQQNFDALRARFNI